MERPLRVLFLTRYPELGASSRYRVYQYLPYLEKHGIESEVQSFMDDDLYRLAFSHGQTLKKLVATARATIRRTAKIAAAQAYDVIVMQRELLPFGPPILERSIKHRKTPLVFDYDDALFIAKPSRFNPIATALRSPRKIRTIFRISDLVLAGNDWLRDQARRYGANAITLEVAENTSRFLPRSRRSGDAPVTIGWLGSPSTVKYLNLVAPVLRQLAADFPQLRFIQMGGGDFTMHGVPWESREWSLGSEVEALHEFDIGLMPLPDEEWALGKSGGKARTYMAAGVVPVCSALGYNLQLIQHGKTGFLCTTLNQWKQTLNELIANAELRHNIGQQAQQEVKHRFAPETIAGELARALRSVAKLPQESN
ncbi:MAG: glycosyl transferase [Pirellulaceae bacterium]|nr:MAG: glycosyl transferase [Pirellulaceae bacterium]